MNFGEMKFSVDAVECRDTKEKASGGTFYCIHSGNQLQIVVTSPYDCYIIVKIFLQIDDPVILGKTLPKAKEVSFHQFDSAIKVIYTTEKAQF